MNKSDVSAHVLSFYELDRDNALLVAITELTPEGLICICINTSTRNQHSGVQVLEKLGSIFTRPVITNVAFLWQVKNNSYNNKGLF